MDNLLINENKNCEREYNGEKYARYAIRTPLITNNDNIVDVARTYAAEHLEQGDILFFSESRRLHAKSRDSVRRYSPEQLGQAFEPFRL